MADLIQDALAVSKTQLNPNISPSTAKAVDDAANLLAKGDELNKKLEELPTMDEIDLILREKEKKIFDKKKEADEFLLLSPEQQIELIKQELKRLTIRSIGWPIKLLTIDPKILQGVALFKSLKKLRKQRKNITELNQDRAAKIHRYPMKKVKQLKEKLPTLPTLPTSLAELPSVPKIPPLPVGGKLPKLPLPVNPPNIIT